MSYTARLSSVSATINAYHYHAIFGDVCSTRFQKLARFLFTSSWVLCIVLAIPTSKSWFWTFLPLRAGGIALGLFLVTCLRKNNLHVDFLGYKTLASQVVGQLLNKKFIWTLIIYMISATLFFSIVFQDLTAIPITTSSRIHQYPPLNDQFVFYWFFSFYASLIYSLQHAVFDKDRLIFTYGNFHTHPKNTIAAKLPQVISNTIIFSLFTTITAPLVYLLVRSYIIDVVLFILGFFLPFNQNQPSYNVTLGLFFKTLFFALVLFASWEMTNMAFNAYLSIGCLHRGHAISELSADPLGTLIEGLKSDKLFTKMTAFQELAYIAKSDDPDARLAIYNRNNKREFLWGEILQECEKTIRVNNINVNNTLVKEPEKRIVKPRRNSRDQHIFGRDYYSIENEFKDSDLYVKPLRSESSGFFDNSTIAEIITHLKKAWKTSKDYYHLFIISGFGIPFRHSVLRETERICPVPVTVGNAIIAVSLLTTHAYDEDKKGTVSSTVADVMNILEQSVSSCGRFAQNPPEDLVDRDEDNLISVLHDLSMNAFFEVTMKYSDVLKDVTLPSNVLRLVNWTFETASDEHEY